jgi:hypothetical protein
MNDSPGRQYFTEAEAQILVGRRYRATARYAQVPEGSVGVVSGIYPVGGRFGVDITWQGIAGGSPLDLERGGLTDGFSRRDLALVFTAGVNRDKRAMVPLDGPDGLDVASEERSVASEFDDEVSAS